MTAQYILRKDTERTAIVDRIASQLRALPQTRAWSVTVAQYHAKRSDQQNAYLWGVVYKTISDATGYSSDEIHELLGKLFLPDGEIRIGGTVMRRRKSTATLSKMEFAEYVDRVIAWAASEGGIVIPAPDYGSAE